MGIFKKLKQFLSGLSLWSGKKARKKKRKPKKTVRKKARRTVRKPPKKMSVPAVPVSGKKPPRKPRKKVPLKAKPKPKPVKPGKIMGKPALPKEKLPGIFLGCVTHYFPKAHAAVVKLEETLNLGDSIVILGKSGKIRQKVKSIQINRIPIDQGRPGEEIGLEVKAEVGAGDKVYRL